MKCPIRGAAELIHDTGDQAYSYKEETTTAAAVTMAAVAHAERPLRSSTTFTMRRIAVLVAHDQHANTLLSRLVNQRVREAPKCKRASPVIGRGSQPRLLNEQPRDPFEFVEKPCNQSAAGCMLVPATGVIQIMLRTWMQAVGHSNLARNLARAAGPSNSVTDPFSISASRIAAT